MKPLQLVLLAVIAAIAVGVLVLATRNPQPPLLPADRDHAFWSSAQTCLECHGSGRASPQSAKHPIGDDCLRCHGRR